MGGEGELGGVVGEEIMEQFTCMRNMMAWIIEHTYFNIHCNYTCTPLL